MAAIGGTELIQSQGSGVRSFFQVSSAGARSKDLGPSSTTFSGHKPGVGLEVEQLDYEPASIYDVGVGRWRINYLR